MDFKISITGDKWPSDYSITASGWATAIARAVREWKKSAGKGSRTPVLTIKAVKQVELSGKAMQ